MKLAAPIYRLKRNAKCLPAKTASRLLKPLTGLRPKKVLLVGACLPPGMPRLLPRQRSMAGSILAI